MKNIVVSNTKSLKGSVNISGAKNSVLPLMCATILSDKVCELVNVPNVEDVETLKKVIVALGSKVEHINDKLFVDGSALNKTKATYGMVQKMRASILVLGPLLARFKHCEVSLPGGCAIGDRPVNLHLKAMEALGAEITIHDGYIEAFAPDGLKGADIIFDKITVGGTENALMAASMAKGKTRIFNAAQEPEIVQLCEYLKSGGVSIKGIGSNNIEINGSAGNLLTFPPTAVIPDRIEAGTYMCAAAILGSKLEVNDIHPSHLINVVSKLQEMGCQIEIEKNKITISRNKPLRPIDITTAEYPGFPTDMQAQIMAVMTQAEGASTVQENLFENRFMNVAEFRRMGANIKLHNNMATIIGPCKLEGTDVTSTDLRASASLLIMGLVAKGETTVHEVEHLLRGYEDIVGKFSSIGAEMKFS